MGLPKISIITVTYNAADLLPTTIRSVFSQTYPNIEYIIIDGASKDCTLEVIKPYRDKIAIFVSEPDKGIYDAMNKGLSLATGDYVWFLNAGDSIYSSTVVLDMFARQQGVEASALLVNNNLKPFYDVYYGETMIVSPEGKEVGLRRLRAPEKLTWCSFRWGMLVCHQSILIKKSLVDTYNMKYKCSADFNWVLEALKKSQSNFYSGGVLANFLQGGKSRQMMVLSWKERFEIMSRNYGLIPTAINHGLIFFRLFYHWIRDRRF